MLLYGCVLLLAKALSLYFLFLFRYVRAVFYFLLYYEYLHYYDKVKTWKPPSYRILLNFR